MNTLPLFSAAALALAACASPESTPTYQTIGEIHRETPVADAIFAEDAVIEKLTDDVFGWSEGPVYIPETDTVLFTDVPGNTIHAWSEEDGLSVFLSPAGLANADPEIFREPGANGLIRTADPNVILMGDHGNRALASLTLDTLEKTLLVTEYEGARFNSPNDLVLADSGAIYFTDPPYGLKGVDDSPARELDFAGVYRFDPATGEIAIVDDRLTKPNGVILSPDQRTLYVTQSEPSAAHIYAYDLDTEGMPTARRLFADLTPQVEAGMPGLPDGMAMDTEGRLYSTGPGGVRVFAPDGTVLARVETGTAAANTTFGGPAGSTLYITSGAFLARVETQATGLGF